METRDFSPNVHENSNTKQNYESSDKLKTGQPSIIVKTDVAGNIELIEMTEMEVKVYEIVEDSNMNKSDKSKQKKFLHGLYRFFTVFNEFFKLPKTYMFHVNINTDLISKEDSDKRVIWLLTFFALFQSLIFSILVVTLLRSLKNYSTEVKIITYDTEVLPVVQKLVIIFGDGTSFFMVMYKSLELAIIQDQKFNFDERGFFAYDQINHIQTLVGNPYSLNYMHYSKFNYKKILG